MRGLLLNLSDTGAKLILSYGICTAIIVMALLAMGFLRRHTKKQMRPQTVKKACEKAKAYATELCNQSKGAQILLGATKLHHLSVLVSEATWLAFQIVEGKKDILFEGIANGLDTLATELVTAAQQGYLTEEEYEVSIKSAIGILDEKIEKLSKMVEKGRSK
ncbi:MAG: hypothetical protein IJV83_00270 [Clostridia bacterium]|nr:hypothetical protein [Clostridia bacterium]